jgi:hypothetical protein
MLSVRSKVILFVMEMQHECFCHYDRLTFLISFPKTYLHYDISVPGEC